MKSSFIDKKTDRRAINIYCEALLIKPHPLFVREAFEVFWGHDHPDHSHHFLDPFSLLHLDLKLQRDSTSHRKIGDINEALQICKQSTQIASIYINAFRRNSI